MHINKNIAISETGFIFNPATGDTFSVNPIGQEILNMVKQDKNDEEIIASLLNIYAADKDTLEKDLYDFKSVLKELKLAQLT